MTPFYITANLSIQQKKNSWIVTNLYRYWTVCVILDHFSSGNSCGMPWEYNQKVNNNNNEHLAQTTVWIFVDKYTLAKRSKGMIFFNIYFVQIIFFKKNLYVSLIVVKLSFNMLWSKIFFTYGKQTIIIKNFFVKYGFIL